MVFFVFARFSIFEFFYPIPKYMAKIRFTIGNKILIGFASLILIYLINGVVNLFILKDSEDKIRFNNQSVAPSLSSLYEFILIVNRSEMLITNWVYLPKGGGEDSKRQLRYIQNQQYPQLKEQLEEVVSQWQPMQKNKLVRIISDFDTLVKVQKDIMKELVTFDDYEDPMKKFRVTEWIEKKILPSSENLKKKMEEIINEKKQESEQVNENITASFASVNFFNFILFVAVVVVGGLVSVLTSRAITRPVKKLNTVIQKLSLGELPEDLDSRKSDDEIGDMTLAMDKLVSGLRTTSTFAENIGKGHYDTEFASLGENDILGNSLIEMRNNLKKVAEDDKRRAWATEGLALFGDILRSYTHSMTELTDKLIAQLVRYTHSNQGALFVLEETEYQEPYLVMGACYAWDKKKYINMRIEVGDGLVGQAWQEKDTIYITDVPKDYIVITSGLGQATPRNILIVPLIYNEKVQGVIEIASFEIYQPHEIEFIQRIAENIASTLSNVKTNETTRRLLEQSQELTEEMRAQEEEMRQNMEELEATQEEMRRNEQQYIEEIRYLKERLTVPG
jgi:putative methionine-R-sulfoxide reductase with GAF domain/HAMP domain-containing protein